MRSFILAMNLLEKRPKYVPLPKVKIRNDKITLSWYNKTTKIKLFLYIDEKETINFNQVNKDKSIMNCSILNYKITDFPDIIVNNFGNKK